MLMLKKKYEEYGTLYPENLSPFLSKEKFPFPILLYVCPAIFPLFC